MSASATSLAAQRELILESDVAELVLAALELAGYEALPAHDPKWIAARIGMDADEIQRTLEVLAAGGAITRHGRHWRVAPRRYVSTSVDRTGHVRKARGWAERALRTAPPAAGFGYLLSSISDRDLPKAGAILRDAHERIRRLAERSTPVDRLLLITYQIASLDSRPLER